MFLRLCELLRNLHGLLTARDAGYVRRSGRRREAAGANPGTRGVYIALLLLRLHVRFLLGLLNGMMVASKTLVSDVCGKEHETVGMGVVTSE